MTEVWREGGFGIYLHWPFCEAKCPYCDFNSHVSKTIDQDQWRHAYLSEIDRYADELPGRTVQSIFFGGGTPSLMDPSTVSAVIDRIAARWRIPESVEITLEANPSSVEATRFAGYREAGINRVSLGVQALNDPDLKRLGRLHSVAEARRALEVAQTTFDRASFDLIYARQDQTAAQWEAELREALDFGFPHMSLYQLTVEDGTAFGDRFHRGRLPGLPSEDLAAELYEMTLSLCEDHGRPMYEVSNYARPGEESRHNLIYWRCGDYAGLGPGAHGRITDSAGTKWAVETPLSPAGWMEAVGSRHGQETREALSGRDQCVEFLLMGLRLREGVAMDRIAQMSGQSLPMTRIEELRDAGVLVAHDNRIIVKKQYFNILNTVISEILPDYSVSLKT